MDNHLTIHRSTFISNILQHYYIIFFQIFLFNQYQKGQLFQTFGRPAQLITGPGVPSQISRKNCRIPRKYFHLLVRCMEREKIFSAKPRSRNEMRQGGDEGVESLHVLPRFDLIQCLKEIDEAS